MLAYILDSSGISASTQPFVPLLLLPLLLFTVVYYTSHIRPYLSIPGPLNRRLSPLPLWYTAYAGTEARAIASLHKTYGPIVLIAPGQISIADHRAIHPIYIEKGGFAKIPQYRNYDVDGHASIFSTDDNVHRAKRAKAVAPMFAQGRVREACADGLVAGVVDEFVEVLGRKGGEAVNVLDLSRRVANDALSGYLFGERCGAFEELRVQEEEKIDGAGLSAGPFVDGFVAVGKFYLLPPKMFALLISFSGWWYPDPGFEASDKQINEYAEKIVSRSSEGDTDATDTYQSKLLNAGISPSETIAQCKDLIFAGTDSTSTNLATILWNLCQSPEVLQKLYRELSSADDQSQAPLLRATVREGLRVGMANPTRLPRVVPRGGWQWGGYEIPEGTSVGCSSYCLHFDSELFPEPFVFKPERWLGDSGVGSKDSLDDMKTAWFAFGAGTRQCIARTFATEELTVAVKKVVLSRVLEGASAVGETIEYLDWFNSHIIGGKIEIKLKQTET